MYNLLQKNIQPQYLQPVQDLSAEWLLADAQVDNLTALLSGLTPGVAVQLVEGDADPLAALGVILAIPGLRRLHLLGHGRPGEITLGNRRLDSAGFAAGLEAFSLSGNPGLEICFWSCHTGQGATGQAFLQQIADLTGATVYASDSLVGHIDQGGSWRLNVAARPFFFDASETETRIAA